MTLTELLATLKKKDRETWDKINEFYWLKDLCDDFEYVSDEFGHHNSVGSAFPCGYDEYVIQGCIQRAIESRKWFWKVYKGSQDDRSHYICTIQKEGPKFWLVLVVEKMYGATAAEALLAAYLGALESEG